MIWLALCYLLVVLKSCWSSTDDEFQTVDVVKLASRVYGTEVIFLKSPYQDRTYRFEDFFWTGSGDGSEEDDYTIGSDGSSTVYKTKTVISTVYMETPSEAYNTSSNGTKCVFDCEGPIKPTENISPTPAYTIGNEPTEDFDADPQFWLLTVLKSDGNDPVITDLKNSLAKLYKTAFHRHQEQHLGIMDRHKRATEEPVHVHIHSVEKIHDNGNENLQVVYHVSVAGRPVPAYTAAEDMTLVSDEEVQKEIGVPFVIKAEPYLKESAPAESLSRAQNTWVVIGVTIVSLLVLLLVIAFLILGCTKRKIPAVPSQAAGIDNRRQVFERGVSHDNKAFENDDQSTARRNQSPTYINFRNQPSNQTIRSNVGTNRPHSAISSSSSSSTSLDISPLMGIKKQKTPPKKPPRPKAALNKTVPMTIRQLPQEFFESDSSSSSRKGSPDTILMDNHDPGVMSPKSYLSMPSVKSFPRGNMPEPLNKVLEPVSVLHLDMPDEENNDTNQEKHYKPTLMRHGSVGAVEDPGIIGPVVWDWHCQRLNHGVSMDEGMNDLKTTSSITKMRKRFHDLLDDTFSLFGSRRESPVDTSRPPAIEVKSHSAANTRPTEDDDVHVNLRPRPKTTDSRRAMQTPNKGSPRGAWTSIAPSPMVRPLSAGPVAPPLVNVDHVLASGSFRSNDPAVPLIAAIKSEIQKCSLPGSTTDLKNA